MSALFTDHKLIVFHGDTCFSLNFVTRTINDRGKDIRQSFNIPFSKVDAVLRWDEEVVFFFKGMDCIKYDLTKKSVSAGYPKKILFEWKASMVTSNPAISGHPKTGQRRGVRDRVSFSL